MVTIVRRDLSPGQRVAQTVHAAADLSADQPDEFREWKKLSNSVVCLECEDEEALFKAASVLDRNGIKHSIFYEPDFGNEATSISFFGDESVRKKFRDLSLCLKDPTPYRSKIYDGMLRCEQTQGVDMLDHGIAVFQQYKKIYKHLTGVQNYPGELPAWIDANKDLILDRLAPLSVIFDYTINHDCGKHVCLSVGEDGKRRYPGHAEESAKVAARMGLSKDVCRLIAQDMDFHTLKSEGIQEFASRPDAVTLMVVAVAEVLANAEMFGKDSDSFKIKWKHLEKRGRQVMEAIKASQLETEQITTNTQAK